MLVVGHIYDQKEPEWVHLGINGETGLGFKLGYINLVMCEVDQ